MSYNHIVAALCLAYDCNPTELESLFTIMSDPVNRAGVEQGKELQKTVDMDIFNNKINTPLLDKKRRITMNLIAHYMRTNDKAGCVKICKKYNTEVVDEFHKNLDAIKPSLSKKQYDPLKKYCDWLYEDYSHLI